MTDPIPVEELIDRYGSARHPRRKAAHTRPAGMTDATVEALGKLSAAMEVVEHARGHLYAFHRLSGTADLQLQRSLDDLRAAGHAQLAERIDQILVGRDVIAGRWTFELIEDYDANYWTVFREAERSARAALGVAEPHVYESDMKHREQS